MAIYFGSERCDGAKDAQTNVAVNTYYNSTTGVKVATVNNTDIYAPFEALPDVTVTPYYSNSTGVKIATVSGKDIYSPSSFSNETGNMIVGSIIAWAGNGTIPEGWLLCDGSEVSKSTYNALYQVIRDDYGTPKDKNNFVLPKITDSRYLQGNTKSGTNVNAGLPNIKGEGGIGWISKFKTDGKGLVSGPFAFAGKTGYGVNNDCTSANDQRIDFDASRSNAVYGKSTTVTPTSITVRYLICWKNMIPTQLHIAMPNWQSNLMKDIKSECHKNAGSGYTVTANGFILFLEIDDGKSGIGWTGLINGNYVFYTARSPQSYWENTNLQLIPVSLGDIVLTDGTYGPNAKVQFIPCKPIYEKNVAAGYIGNKVSFFDQSCDISKWTTCTATSEGYPFSTTYDPPYTLASLILTIQSDCIANIRVNIDNSDTAMTDGHAAICLKIDDNWKVIANGATSHWGGGTTVTLPLKAGMQIRGFVSGYGNKHGNNGGPRGIFLTEYCPTQYDSVEYDKDSGVIDGTLLCDKTLWTGVIQPTPQLVYITKNDCGLMIKELSATNSEDNQAYSTCYYVDEACTKPIYSHGESYTNHPESYGSLIHLKRGTPIYIKMELNETVRYTTTVAFYEYKLMSTNYAVQNFDGTESITYNGGYFDTTSSFKSKDIYTASEDCKLFVHASKDDIGTTSGQYKYMFIKVNGNIVASACDPGLSDNRQREVSWTGIVKKGDVISIECDDLTNGRILYSYNANKLDYNKIRGSGGTYMSQKITSKVLSLSDFTYNSEKYLNDAGVVVFSKYEYVVKNDCKIVVKLINGYYSGGAPERYYVFFNNISLEDLQLAYAGNYCITSGISNAACYTANVKAGTKIILGANINCSTAAFNSYKYAITEYQLEN